MDGRDQLPAEIEAAISAAEHDESPSEGAFQLALIASKAAAALFRVARANAESRRGQPDWSSWARVQNSARDVVLRTAAAREAAIKVRQQNRPVA